MRDIESNAALAKIEEVGDKLQTAGDKISGAGQKLLPVIAAVAGLGTAAVKTTADFDTSMSQVQATMGITKDAMSELNGESVNTVEALRDLAKASGCGPCVFAVRFRRACCSPSANSRRSRRTPTWATT